MPKQYEFDATENQVIGGLAGWMGFVAVMMMAFGGLFLLGGLVQIETLYGVFGVAQGLLGFVIGAWLWSASRSFKDIVRTEGTDIVLLMMALRRLRGAFRLQGVVMILGTVFLVLAVAVLVHEFGSHLH